MQTKSDSDAVAKVSLSSLWKRGPLVRLYDVNAYGCLQRDVNHVRSMRRTSIVIHICTNTVALKFVADSKDDRAHERTAPRAVNICYTGCLKGIITDDALEKVICNKVVNRRGPCGSEIHIDTTMGVVQIFGNKNSFRQITCKAFVSKKEADGVIQYLCDMVCIVLFVLPPRGVLSVSCLLSVCGILSVSCILSESMSCLQSMSCILSVCGVVSVPASCLCTASCLCAGSCPCPASFLLRECSRFSCICCRFSGH